MDLLLVAFEVGLVHGLEDLEGQFDVLNQAVTAGLGEIFTHDDTHQLERFAVRSHGVGGNNPAALTELVGNSELIENMVLGRVEAESHQGQTLSTAFAHDDEAEFLQLGSQVISSAGQVDHDGAVAMLAQADHLVVLADDLGSSLGEVEGETGLVGTEVVDVEDKFLGQVFGGSPNNPANTGVDLLT